MQKWKIIKENNMGGKNQNIHLDLKEIIITS